MGGPVLPCSLLYKEARSWHCHCGFEAFKISISWISEGKWRMPFSNEYYVQPYSDFFFSDHSIKKPKCSFQNIFTFLQLKFWKVALETFWQYLIFCPFTLFLQLLKTPFFFPLIDIKFAYVKFRAFSILKCTTQYCLFIRRNLASLLKWQLASL